ncbi:hypothetical protein Nmel_002121 [Mimus melanotis]
MDGNGAVNACSCFCLNAQHNGNQNITMVGTNYRIIWLFPYSQPREGRKKHAGKACMASYWTFLDAAAHSSVGLAPGWPASCLGLTPLPEGLWQVQKLLVYKENI